MLTNEWRKASRSGNQGGNCVEARAHEGAVEVRDTKLGDDSPIVTFSPNDWRALLRHEGRTN